MITSAPPAQCCMHSIPTYVARKVLCSADLSTYMARLNSKVNTTVAAGKVDEGDTAMDELMRKMGWKRCPGCGIAVEKISGCAHVICRCRKQFHY